MSSNHFWESSIACVTSFLLHGKWSQGCRHSNNLTPNIGLPQLPVFSWLLQAPVIHISCSHSLGLFTSTNSLAVTGLLVCILTLCHWTVLRATWNSKFLEPNRMSKLHVNCLSRAGRGSKRWGAGRANCLAGPFDYWWGGRIIQKGTTDLPQQCICWLTQGSQEQSVLRFNGLHQKNLWADYLIRRVGGGGHGEDWREQ